MAGLQICFILDSELTSDQHKEIDALDKLAFAGESEDDHPELSGITWASHDWMALGFLGDELVTQLALPLREISVGAEKIWVAGVGGVATYPRFQHKGYAGALLEATKIFMRDTLRIPFGLLICADKLRRFYESAGWQFAAEVLCFSQEGKRRALPACVMILPLANKAWPTGEIDLCGSPW
jgi:GNAT superfamily N-acetyltransferase